MKRLSEQSQVPAAYQICCFCELQNVVTAELITISYRFVGSIAGGAKEDR
ncbi:hypothetical protein [Sphingomonas faeni]|nr:hypothetical protein [Sphingomonas faeni]MCK8456615.1 hypothetical protein [Sphingomonas faeni]